MNWLTSEIRRRLEEATVTSITDDNAKLLAVSTGLLRCCVAHVDGLSSVLREFNFDSGFVLQRAIWEYWREFVFLIRRETAAEDAVRFETNCVMDVLETVRSSDGQHVERAAAAEEWLNTLRMRYPTIVGEVTTQRKKRRGH